MCASTADSRVCFARQRGSHVILIRDEPFAVAIVPQHRMVKLGTLRRILRDISMAVEQFSDLL